jgi:hypothetical protein
MIIRPLAVLQDFDAHLTMTRQDTDISWKFLSSFVFLLKVHYSTGLASSLLHGMDHFRYAESKRSEFRAISWY